MLARPETERQEHALSSPPNERERGESAADTSMPPGTAAATSRGVFLLFSEVDHSPKPPVQMHKTHTAVSVAHARAVAAQAHSSPGLLLILTFRNPTLTIAVCFFCRGVCRLGCCAAVAHGTLVRML